MNVIIALKSDEPVEDILRRLTDVEFAQTRVIGRMVIGAVPAARLAALKEDPAVLTVEVDRPLKPLE